MGKKYYAERRGSVNPEPLNLETLKKFFLLKFEGLEKDLYFQEATGYTCVDDQSIDRRYRMAS